MPLPRNVALAAVALVVALWSPAPVVAGPGDAGAFVKQLGDDAIAVLSGADTDAEQRRTRYRELLDRGFAINTIARFVLGRYWRAATKTQRSEYLVLFREFVLDTYAARLEEYAGQTFEVVKLQPLDKKDTMVNTEIRSPGAPSIRVDYRVRARRDGLKIVDVVVEGVSLITTQRAEFASVINRKGVEGLLAMLRERSATGTASY